MGLKDLLDLEKQLGFYAQYHHENVNFTIHVLGVPLILWTFLVFATSWYQAEPPELIKQGHELVGLDMPITGASFTILVYAVGYLLMEPFAGLIATVLLALGSISAYQFYTTVDNAIPIAIAIHVAMWIAQFYGHFVHEKRAPALFDNLFQAAYQAPFFVLLEVMFMFGYRKDLATRIYSNAEKDIAAWKKQQAEKSK